jgi:hypothetical protein
MVDMEKHVIRAFDRIEGNFKEVNENITELFNHQSSRIPPQFAYLLAGATSLLSAIIAAVVTAVVT